MSEHGTRAMYNARSEPCREACCRLANAEWQRQHRLKMKQLDWLDDYLDSLAHEQRKGSCK